MLAKNDRREIIRRPHQVRITSRIGRENFRVPYFGDDCALVWDRQEATVNLAQTRG
jgi:hypothetical protein